MHKMLRYLLLIYPMLSIFVVSDVYAQSSEPTYAPSIEGTLLMLDDMTPHVAVPVQVLRNGEVIATVLSDERGKYQFINLKPGRYQLRCQVLGGYVYYRAIGDALRVTRYGEEDSGPTTEEDIGEILHIEYSKAFKDIDFRFPPFKKGTWKNYDTLDGLAHNSYIEVYGTPDGVIWFGTAGGVSRYDGKSFVNLTTKDGLTHNEVRAIHRDPDGVMWFGTHTRGISRYDGKAFVNFTTEDGLAHNRVYSIHSDLDGVIWFGTLGGGVSRYDGNEFVNFTTKHGLAGDFVYSICRAPDGVMWFGTLGGGVSRYDGKAFVNFTTEHGLAHNSVYSIHSDPDGVMWFGTDRGVSRYDGKSFANLTTKDGLTHNEVRAIHGDPDGVMWFGTFGGGVSRYDGKAFVNFTKKDGLAYPYVWSIHRDPDGAIWFGTVEVGVYRYDENTFVSFTTKDGLANNDVYPIHRDPDGVMWFGTWSGGVSRYDGEEFVNFTTENGLVNNTVWSIRGDPDGSLWFGTGSYYVSGSGGVSRYDGREFVNFTTEDGLVHNIVRAIHHDLNGAMWFGTQDGISRYDGKEFVNFTTEDGLAGNTVIAIHRNPDGSLWFGTDGGVSRYDEGKFINLTTEDGLVYPFVHSIHRSPDDAMWFGTYGGGISRYDGKEFVNFTTENGLANSYMMTIHRSPDGVMWFGTEGGGVSYYDGIAWTSLDTRDGLEGNAVPSIHQDLDGSLWFATDRGITRYRRSTTRPKVRIVSVTTDETYHDFSAIPAFDIGTHVSIEYSALDFKTLPEKRQYQYRIKEIDSDWRKPTKKASFDHTFREPGTYTFQVKAIDRDLNYSDPESVEIRILPPPIYKRAWFIIGVVMILLVALTIVSAAYLRRRRQVHAYELMAVQELQDAREMQMSLIPESAPSVQDFDIAGRTVPANTVGGDFFDYLSLPDGRTGLTLADVSGKGLKGAMNAVMANGMLYDAAAIEASCGRILSRLNKGLYTRLDKLMFVALGFATISQDDQHLHWANAGQPYPIVKRGDQVMEFSEDSDLPLAMMPDVAYSDQKLELQPGDIVIFYTDGIIEAENEAEEIYGIERLMALMAGIDPAIAAEDIAEAILQDVEGFIGAAERYDDMTIVVVRRLRG